MSVRLRTECGAWWVVSYIHWAYYMELVAEGVERTGGDRLLALFLLDEADRNWAGFDVMELEDRPRAQFWAGVEETFVLMIERGPVDGQSREGHGRLVRHLCVLLEMHRRTEPDPSCAGEPFPRELPKLDLLKYIYMDDARRAEAEGIVDSSKIHPHHQS